MHPLPAPGSTHCTHEPTAVYLLYKQVLAKEYSVDIEWTFFLSHCAKTIIWEIQNVIKIFFVAWDTISFLSLELWIIFLWTQIYRALSIIDTAILDITWKFPIPVSIDIDKTEFLCSTVCIHVDPLTSINLCTSIEYKEDNHLVYCSTCRTFTSWEITLKKGAYTSYC